MSEQDRLKHIAKTAADARQKLVSISLKVAEHSIYIEDIQECIYQLGYIEGLSSVPEEEENAIQKS